MTLPPNRLGLFILAVQRNCQAVSCVLSGPSRTSTESLLWVRTLYDAVLIVFFPIFTFTYNRAFDSVFGLPDSVTRKAEPAVR